MSKLSILPTFTQIRPWLFGYLIAYLVLRSTGIIFFAYGKSAIETDLRVPIHGHAISERRGAKSAFVLSTNSFLFPNEMAREVSFFTQVSQILFYPMVLLELPLHTKNLPTRDSSLPAHLAWTVVRTKVDQFGIELPEPIAVEGTVLIYDDYRQYLIKTTGYPRADEAGEFHSLAEALESRPGFNGGFLPAGHTEKWNLPPIDSDVGSEEWSYTSKPDSTGAVEFWTIMPGRSSICYSKIIPK